MIVGWLVDCVVGRWESCEDVTVFQGRLGKGPSLHFVACHQRAIHPVRYLSRSSRSAYAFRQAPLRFTAAIQRDA